MTRFTVVEYSKVGYKDTGHDIHAIPLEGYAALASRITDAKTRGFNVVEACDLGGESDLKLWANDNGCLIILPHL